MYKLNKHFRLHKSIKRMLATIMNREHRSDMLDLFSQAQYEASIKPNKQKDEKKENNT